MVRLCDRANQLFKLIEVLRHVSGLHRNSSGSRTNTALPLTRVPEVNPCRFASSTGSVSPRVTTWVWMRRSRLPFGANAAISPSVHSPTSTIFTKVVRGRGRPRGDFSRWSQYRFQYDKRSACSSFSRHSAFDERCSSSVLNRVLALMTAAIGRSKSDG